MGFAPYFLGVKPGDDREARKFNQSDYSNIQAPLGAAVRSLVGESNDAGHSPANPGPDLGD